MIETLDKLSARRGHEIVNKEYEDGIGRILIRTADGHAVIVSITTAKVFN